MKADVLCSKCLFLSGGQTCYNSSMMVCRQGCLSCLSCMTCCSIKDWLLSPMLLSWKTRAAFFLTLMATGGRHELLHLLPVILMRTYQAVCRMAGRMQAMTPVLALCSCNATSTSVQIKHVPIVQLNATVIVEECPIGNMRSRAVLAMRLGAKTGGTALIFHLQDWQS